jgi:hypothetical protein
MWKMDPGPEAPYARHFPSLEESNSPEIGLVFCCVTHRGTVWFSHQREGGSVGRAPACQKKGAIEKALLMNYAAPVQGLPFSRWRA